MKRIYLLAVLLLLASCAQYRYVAEDAPAVEDVTLIMPYSRVFYIDQEGEHYDEAGSDEQQKLLTGLLLSSGLGITDTVDVVGLPNQKDLDWEIESLPRINHKRMGEIVFEGALDKFLESKGARYGLIVFSEGFIKDRKLYKKEVAKAVPISRCHMRPRPDGLTGPASMQCWWIRRRGRCFSTTRYCRWNVTP